MRGFRLKNWPWKWWLVAALAGASTMLGASSPAQAQEDPACLSPDPAQWPAPSKPYFMVVIDTSGSMIGGVGSAPSCSGYPSTRMGHAKCAVRNTVTAFSGQVNFGLAQFAGYNTGCGSHCYGNTSGSPNPACRINCYWAELQQTGGTCGMCGPMDNTSNPATRRGGRVLVPMQVDNFWSSPPSPSNVEQILQYTDNNCSGNTEVTNTPTDGPAYGLTPLNGALRDMKRYFQTGWTNPDNSSETYPTPLSANDRACRSVNVILLTDGDETCDSQSDAVNAARDLFENGVIVGDKTYKIRVWVINFAGGDQVKTDAIAAAGGTGTSQFATNEAQLSIALSNIISGSVSPEVCDNTDNNCNGCTDEGYRHYCNIQPIASNCCEWTTTTQRNTCLANYQNSIAPSQPSGDLRLLPCTTAAQATEPARWLCFDPKERCDNVDNNCYDGIDDGVKRCGNPLHCPQAETCNGADDDCDGVIDNGGVCSGCTPSPEVCDGCDNDCDGIADDGIAPVPCGLPNPANCAGQMSCKPPVAVPVGGCTTGGGFNACNNNPQTEICDGLDNDCDGIADNGVAPTACVPPGTPGGLVYGGDSQCRMGTQPCDGTCSGFVGPSTEVCDGIDNDCDGQVDENAVGTGLNCGVSQAPCTPGVTACVNGVLVCQGGTQPQPEVCDGIDNDCDGQIDDAPLQDAPAASGCWTEPGNCCSAAGETWCPPTGATCHGTGSLSAPCHAGTLACQGASGWVCQGAKAPSAEVCDGLDNNCNSAVDDNVPGTGQSCGTDVGECSAGTVQCVSGSLICTAVTGSAEVCDGLDNDCDGQVDNNVPGLGQPCGNSTPPCQAGVTACVGGNVVCQGGVQPQPEQCDGIDNNCDGYVDNAPLVDQPPAGQTGCWPIPGTSCSFDGLSWDSPAGASCTGTGSLASPCAAGVLVCAGASGWSCHNAVLPGAEVCDGIDNDCDGNADNVAPSACVPPGTPSNLVYGGTSQCRQGSVTCGSCAGFVGPSNEICDGIDNDCDGEVDEDAAGIGAPCGFNMLPCTPGTTACVNGALVCQGGVQPQPEVCDGIDNNCNGSIDEAPLADAPSAAQMGCWDLPGDCCKYLNLEWCPPAGGNCNDNGSLAAPCNRGFLACDGTNGWACRNAKSPTPEVCDGIDNDCNSAIDDGTLPEVGDACGSDVGECSPGSLDCFGGVLTCVGGQTPTEELCDGLDNNCDGNIDEGIPTGGTCWPAYDTELYPGDPQDRRGGACQAGVLQCDTSGGMQCVGGVGPQPEVCDGIDNDCDGQVDEPGPAPDGINGTANPTGQPEANIGDACGVDEGECKQGTWGCRHGIFACVGGQSPQPEQCDCLDNDCDGVIDNDNGDGGPPLCGQGKDCVRSDTACQCAGPCQTGEFPCPAGQECEAVQESSSGEPLGNYCVSNADPCGDCSKVTRTDAQGNVLCAPAGTDPAGCLITPECKCKGVAGCHEPCAGVSCTDGKVCARFGPRAGECVENTCYFTMCAGCDQACNLGSCVDSPCTAESCPGQVCKPSQDFTSFTCVDSCADVNCEGTQVCVNGKCEPGCDPPCTDGSVCDLGTGECVKDKCEGATGITCDNGACCNPITGTCGNCPCEGVLCPEGLECVNDECVKPGTGGSGGGGGAGGEAGAAGTAGSAGGGAAGAPDASTGGGTQDAGEQPDAEVGRRVFGLATGGGGCRCGIPQSPNRGAGALAGLLVMVALGLRRRGGAK